MSVQLQSIGSRKYAESLLQRGIKEIPAYQKHIGSSQVTSIDSYATTDKNSYLLTNDYQDLLAPDADEAFTLFASSGSSGSPFYWPQLKSEYRDTVPRLEQFLERSFSISNQRTLAVVGLALGSWIGGEHLSWALKSYALQSSNSFSVFSPGNNHEEILNILDKAENYFDQMIIFLCPSAISHLKLKALSMGIELPNHKLRYVVVGESFPEAAREMLQEEAGCKSTENLIYSLYGSADTGTLGVESDLSITIRKVLSKYPDLANSLAFKGPIPHFFHNIANDIYLETENDELVVTKWQGIPLLRYNLHDSAKLISWDAISKAIRNYVTTHKIEDELCAVFDYVTDSIPDLIAVNGRADSTLILCGSNISEMMLDTALRSKELSQYLTGKYTARLSYENGYQRLALDVELCDEQLCIPKQELYRLLIESIGYVQPEFLNDWNSFYKEWDNDEERSIIDLTCTPWGTFNQMNLIKHRGIQQ